VCGLLTACHSGDVIRGLTKLYVGPEVLTFFYLKDRGATYMYIALYAEMYGMFSVSSYQSQLPKSVSVKQFTLPELLVF